MQLNKGDYLWLLTFCGVSALLVIPATHRIFINGTQAHPYLLGFIKFMVLATLGELLAIRIVSGRWSRPHGMAYKSVLWGVFGMMIVLMFEIYLSGVGGAVKKELLFVGDGAFSAVLTAFFISALMNLTFAPAFMAVHRMTDTYIDMRADGQSPNWREVVAKIDWPCFIAFVVARTIPFFWIPAHTVTFLLPPEYRVLSAAYLSIALGAILSYARRKKT